MDPQALSDIFGLGRASALHPDVSRGELGSVHRLVTDRGRWAVKQTFEAPSATELAALERVGDYQESVFAAGLPCPRPVRATTGRFVAKVDGEAVRVCSWVDFAAPDTDLDPGAVGRLLARLHAINRAPVGVVDAWFQEPVGRPRWQRLLKAARAANAPYADRLDRLLPALLKVEATLTPMARVQTCHLDLWADNLRRTDAGGLCVIDFDNAGPGDPSREVAMLAFEFGRGVAARQRQLYRAYLAADGPGRVSNRADFGLTLASLHHIGARHLAAWPAARDSEQRDRALAGVQEFLGAPFLLGDVDRLLAALA